MSTSSPHALTDPADGSPSDVTDDVAVVYVVCTGNICRSPLAAALLESEARRHLGDEAPIWVHSAGVRGLVGRPATEQMRRQAIDRGLDLSGHRGAEAEASAIRDADLVLTMTESQRRQVRRLAPVARDRTFTLKELVRLLDHDRDGGDEADTGGARDRLRRLVADAHAARPRVPGPDETEDIADPYGASTASYAACAGEIEDLIAALADHLFTAATDSESW